MLAFLLLMSSATLVYSATVISSLPYTISSSGVYTMTGALSGSGNVAIQVNSGVNDVFVDCQNYAITWSGNYTFYFPGSNNNVTLYRCNPTVTATVANANAYGVYIGGIMTNATFDSFYTSAYGKDGANGAAGSAGTGGACPSTHGGNGGAGGAGHDGGAGYGLYGLIQNGTITSSSFYGEGGTGGDGDVTDIIGELFGSSNFTDSIVDGRRSAASKAGTAGKAGGLGGSQGACATWCFNVWGKTGRIKLMNLVV